MDSDSELIEEKSLLMQRLECIFCECFLYTSEEFSEVREHYGGRSLDELRETVKFWKMMDEWIPNDPVAVELIAKYLPMWMEAHNVK